MTEDVLERYDDFNTKVCREDLVLGYSNNQPIPYTYSDLINDYDYDGTPTDASLEDNEEL